MTSFILNNKRVDTDKPNGTLLLDFIRYHSRLTGTKIGCREGDCGACTVLIGDLKDDQIEYLQVTSCLTPIGNVHGKHVVTVEGLNMDELTPVQQFMVEESGTQCGFCTVGFVVSLTGYCLANSNPSYEKAIAAIDGNICRCTGYKSIERAAQHITNALQNKNTDQTVNYLVENKFIPDYFTTIPARIKAIEKISTNIYEGKLVGGGTDLYVQIHDQLEATNINLVANQHELKFIKINENDCELGGGTTVKEFAENQEIKNSFPNLAKHIKLVSSSPIRNISTIAGNFVNASPIGDLTAFFLALNAKITLSDSSKNRTIYLKEFYKGYKDLDKSNAEIVTRISFQLPNENTQFNLEKVSKRIHLDIASVNAAIQIQTENNVIKKVHASAGGVGPTPKYLSKTVEFLEGKSITPENINKANEIMQSEISPISDVRGTASYKRLLLRQLFYAHFLKLFPKQMALKELV